MKGAHYALAASAGFAALAAASGPMRVPNREASLSLKAEKKHRPKKDRSKIKAARKQACRSKKK